MVLTYDALARVRAEWEDARNQRSAAEHLKTGTESYFAGKYFGIVEAVAQIEGVSWAEADDLIRYMGDKPVAFAAE